MSIGGIWLTILHPTLLFQPHHVGMKIGGNDFFLLMPQEEHDTFTLPVEVLMVKPCGLTIALVVAELFPLESFSMKFCMPIDWVARHIIEMCALEGKHLACINGETLDTSKNCMSNGMSRYGYYIILSVYMEGHKIINCASIIIVM